MLYRNKKENDFHQGKWNGLGGKLQQGETPEACARREIFEESGLVAEKLLFKGVILFPEFDTINDWFVFVFAAEKISGVVIDSPEGDLAWIDDSDLFKLNLWEGDYIFMKWLDNKGFFSAKFVYSQKKLQNHQVTFYQ